QGYILTNNHVVENSERVTVAIDEKTKFQAHVVGTDPKTDLAVVKIDNAQGKTWPTLSFGNSEQLQVGAWAIAIGSPVGLVQSGRVKRGWIGLIAQDMDADLAKYFKSPRPQGALVSDILPGGPASQAAIQKGDVILKYGDQAVNDATQLKALVGKAKSGSDVN